MLYPDPKLTHFAVFPCYQDAQHASHTVAEGRSWFPVVRHPVIIVPEKELWMVQKAMEMGYKQIIADSKE